jgi:hypothetical protein
MQEHEVDALLASIPEEVMGVIGNPPLLSNEDKLNYYTMVALFAKSIKPDNLIAWMLVQDLTDYRVEIARYRRLKVAALQRAARKEISDQIQDRQTRLNREVSALNVAAQREMQEFAKNHSKEESAKKKEEIDSELAVSIANAERDAERQIDSIRNRQPTDKEFVEIAYPRYGICSIDSFERIDALLRSAEARFFATLHELERHLDGLGARFREELEAEARKVIDVVPITRGPVAPDVGKPNKLAGLAAPELRPSGATRRRLRAGR